MAAAQTSALRMVIGTDVACRNQPELTAPAVGALQPGDSFVISGVTRDDSGEATWYEQRGYILLGSCWVSAPLTTAYDPQDPDAALLAVAEHALELGAEANFEHLVRVDNLLTQRELGLGRYGRASTAPPMLQLRHLQVVDRAARAVGGNRATERDPMRMAWVLGHSRLVSYFEPGGLYHVPGTRLWELYEQYETSPDAELIAWTAAEAPIFTDECYAECVLSVLARTYARYWNEFPRGNNTQEALTIGAGRAERAARFCILVSAGYLAEDLERIGVLIGELRTGLEDVPADQSAALLMHLTEIEEMCVADGVADLTNSAAIPGLARALGLGFAIVRQSLVAFGDEAVPAVLDVATSQPSGNSEVNDGLLTLRFMVEGPDSPELSTEMLEEIRTVTEQRLTGQQYFTTLERAVDLAIVLDDPALRQIVEVIASNPNELAARGLDNPAEIEYVQRRAAEVLAGVPPRPRP